MQRFHIKPLIIIFTFFSISLYGGDFSFKVFPQNYSLSLDGNTLNEFILSGETRIYDLPSGNHLLSLSAPGYNPKSFEVPENSSQTIEEKLEKSSSYFELINEAETGEAPKSVEFTPDGKNMVVALLNGPGIDVFSAENGTRVGRFEAPSPYGEQQGFVESAFVESRREIWVSQMTTGRIHIFSMDNFQWLSSFPSGGVWSKVITLDQQENLAYVSNWCSNNISVLDIETHEVLQTIPVNGIPRGSVISQDGSELYVCLFDTGNIDVINLHQRRVDRSLILGPGAKRHIVADFTRGRLYVSDMYWGKVYVIDIATETLIKTIFVGYNMNTVKLSPDGQTLFGSVRGRNNQESYLLKGPDFGIIGAIDCSSLSLVSWIWGRNQPTGLAVSPDGNTLAFTDFLDNNLETYDISGF